ncbi:nif-specific transcriptional activator NifA [Bradyrhizobium diazoefficiens]|nr:nif-specific transcriptional activator NifA [Bradyrhizobium diazoefficiens]WLA66631.1 nif-specific transcriptional activator NifA [Bradyrhizobium diazoefficiens]
MQNEPRQSGHGSREDDQGNGDRLMLHIPSSSERPASQPEPERAPPGEPSHESALAGIFEISKILNAPGRLEVTLANVLGLLQSFVQMRHGLVSLFNDDGVPELTVGAGWSEGTDERYRTCVPQKAIHEIVATGRSLMVENVAAETAFSAADREVLGASDSIPVAFIGVPIRVDSTVVGTLTIDRIPEGSSSLLEYDARLLAMVANVIGQTIKLHRLFAGDREQSLVDKDRLEKQTVDRGPPARERKQLQAHGIIGDSPALSALLEKIVVVARSNSTVLLRGESGTGKELVAKAIHESSVRAKRPFVKLNCAALPETVLESELFGHEKGAFTGAVSARKGRFELADKGTLFLDEIGEISAPFQAKLLRVLQEQEFERVGSNHTIKVDVRVIAATNRNLEEAVARSEFRADLYYRISVVPLLLPPLRERRSDIPLLAREFLRKFNSENGRSLTLEASAIDVLMSCKFPGNVRELENCIERTATLSAGSSIVRSDFACSQGQCLSTTLWKSTSYGKTDPAAPMQPVPAKSIIPLAETAPPPQAVCEPGSLAPSGTVLVSGARMADRERVVAAMEKSGWVQAKAARLLGLTPRQVGYALRKYGIEIKRF